MEVTKVNDHVTHAVIGAAKAIDFAIDDSAEFFQILSSTLYKHQKLAVVRETLCNAWDAHIENGCTDKPIQITLNENHLIIRDFGTGIAKDKIGPIYGTYGGSTKRSNTNVTGGFGLGCKAPFAYVDHFEVTSYHQGEKTIYNLSKSNAEVAGKPSIIPMVSVPTQETGIQVKIAIKGSDYNEFLILIAQIIHNGDMNAVVNGDKFQTMNMEDRKHNFIILRGNRMTGFENHAVLLRYGHVIYPIEEHSEINELLRKVQRYLTALNGDRSHYGYRQREGGYQIVFQAEPNTISVTPSRESLSMKAHTIATLNDLMLNFLAQLEKFTDGTYDKLLKEADARTCIDVSPSTLLRAGSSIPNLTRIKQGEMTAKLVDYPEISRHYAMNNPNERTGFGAKVQKTRLNSLVASRFGDRGLMQGIRRHMLARSRKPSSTKMRRELRDPSMWFTRRFKLRWQRMVARCPDVNIEKLMLFGKHNSDRWEPRATKFTPIMKANPKKWDDEATLMDLMRNIVVLSFNQRDIEEGDWENAAFRYWYGLGDHGALTNCLVYMAPRNPAKLEAIRKFFQETGVYVLDLTEDQQVQYEERMKEKGVIDSTLKRVKKVGIPAISNIMVKDTRVIRTALAAATDAKLIESPKFVLQFADRNDKDSLPNFTTQGTRDLVDLFGDAGGFVVNVNQEARYIREGALAFGEYVFPRLRDEIISNPRIMSSYAFDYNRFKKEAGIWRSDTQPAFEILEEVPELGEYFDIHHTMTQKDKQYLRLFLEMYGIWSIKDGEAAKQETMKALNAVKVSPAMQTFHAIYQASTANRIIKDGNLLRELRALRENKQLKKREFLRDLFLQLIEG